MGYAGAEFGEYRRYEKEDGLLLKALELFASLVFLLLEISFKIVIYPIVFLYHKRHLAYDVYNRNHIVHSFQNDIHCYREMQTTMKNDYEAQLSYEKARASQREAFGLKKQFDRVVRLKREERKANIQLFLEAHPLAPSFLSSLVQAFEWLRTKPPDAH